MVMRREVAQRCWQRCRERKSREKTLGQRLLGQRLLGQRLLGQRLWGLWFLVSLGYVFLSISSGFAQDSQILVDVDRRAISDRQTVSATVTIELQGV